MALPALAPLLGGIAKGATAAGGRAMASGAVRSAAGGKIKSGITKSVKGGGKKGGDSKISGRNTINPESIIPSPGGALVPMSSPRGGSLSTTVTPKSRQSSSIISTPTSKNDSAIEILQQVKSTTDQILEVEVRDLGSKKEEVKNTKEQIRDEQKLLEKEKKQEEQDKQEQSKAKKRKKSNPIVSAAKKAVGGLWSFLSGLLGDFIKYKILDWISDPKNKEKILGIVKFFQILPGLWTSFKERYIDPWWNFLSKFIGGNFKIFKSFLTVFTDIFTLKFFTDPKEFLNNLLNIPKTLLEVVPGIIGSLLDAVTGGTIKTIGELVDKIFKNPLSGIDFGSLGKMFSQNNFLKGVMDVAGGVGGFISNILLGAAPANAGTLPPGYRPGEMPPSNNTTPGVTPSSNTTPGVTPSSNASAGVTPSSNASAGSDVRFGSVSGDSGSVAYNGAKGAKLSVNYSPFSASDVESKNISIISGKGYRSSTNSNHKGYDFPAPQGTPLYAYLPGTVLSSKYFSGYGNGIEWKDSIYKQKHFFAHMMGPSPLKTGDNFEQGALLGKTGDTGSPDSYHLHWEIGGRGSEVDPGQWVNSHPLPSNKKSETPIAAVTTPQIPQSGSNLNQVQQENQMLESSGMGALQTPIVSNTSSSSQSSTNETMSGSSLGNTIPKSGPWATFLGMGS